MKNYLLIIFTALVMYSSMSNAYDEPVQVAEQWASCVSASDIPCLEMLLNDKYMHTHGTGRVETKQQFIDALASGSRKYDPIHLEDIQVQLFPDVSIVLGKFDLKVLSNGNTIESINRFGMVIQDDQVIYFQATAMP